MYYRSTGTLTTLTAGDGGIADFRQDSRGRTITNVTLTKGAGWRDPIGTVTPTNGLDCYHCTPKTLSVFETAPHQTWTPSAI